MKRISDPALIDEARRRVAYDPSTGRFAWIVSKGGVRVGDSAGLLTTNGYIRVTVDRRLCQAHRLAWAMTYGYWPSGDIDHIDGDRTNNRIANLRLATRGENMQNLRGAKSNSKIGLLGVSRNRGKWMARIKVAGVTHHIGSFETPESAHAAYLQRKRELHPMGTL